MNDWSQIASGAVFLASAAGVLLAYFKYKPGQREAVGMTVAQANMDVAQGTFQMVTSELEDQFKRMAAEQKRLRGEYETYRTATDKRLNDLTIALRTEREEKEDAQMENRRLTARVKQLEEKVDQMKRAGGDLP